MGDPLLVEAPPSVRAPMMMPLPSVPLPPVPLPPVPPPLAATLAGLQAPPARGAKKSRQTNRILGLVVDGTHLMFSSETRLAFRGFVVHL
jgi:hypothetical protein